VRWSARGFYVDDIDEGKEQVFTGRNSAGPCYVATAKGTGQEPNVPALLVTASRTLRIRDRVLSTLAETQPISTISLPGGCSP
jgi:hypothetical protein